MYDVKIKNYELSYNKDGKSVKLHRWASNAASAIDKLCDQFQWRPFLRQFDAETRGLIWALASVDTTGGINPDIRISANEIRRAP